MVEIQLLGGLAITEPISGPDPAAARQLLSSPRLVALLTCLAVSPRFRRRDTLIGLLWPEADQTRARARLRKALFRLRRALGDEAVVNRGAEEVALGAEHLGSDVARFESALAAGETERALGLYAGDLLPGFYISDAPGWESWLEVERRRLRELARAAALRLARERAADGATDDALRWAREACRVAPEDEPAAWELLRLLADRGDRAAALRHYDGFARLLGQELDIQPSAEMRAFAESLRRPPGPGPDSDAGAHAAAAGRPPVVRAPAGDRATVAILPFAYSGPPATEYLADGIADLLATALDGSESLRCVHPGSLVGLLAGGAEPLSEEARCRAVGERFGATYCVLGRIVESAGGLRISAALHAAADGAEPLARASAEGRAEELFALIDRIAGQLLVHAVGAPAYPLAGVAALTTDSLPALKSYLDGELAFRAGRFMVAAEGFRRATIEDSTFALAHYRLAVLCEWAGMHSMAGAAAAQAVAYSARLSIGDRNLLMAFQAYIAGDAALAERLYREILDVHPGSVEAWFHLAKIGYFLDSLRGRRLAGAREALERAAALDPQNIIVQVHLASVAAKERLPEEAEAASGRALALLARGDHTDFVLIVRLQRAHALGDADEQALLSRELEGANDVTLFWCFTLLTVVIGELEAARRVAELLTHPSRARQVRLFGHLSLAELELAHGRWSRAREELRAAAVLDARTAAVHRGLLSLVLFRDPGREELVALRDELLADEGQAAVLVDDALPPYFDAHVDVLDASRVHVLGLLHARLGDTASAERCAATLDALALDALALDAAAAGSLARRAQARDAARGIRALVAHGEGDAAGALAILEACELAAPTYLYSATVLHGRIHERYLRAELLAALHRDAEAGQWYAALGEDSPHGFVYLAPSLLRRAELLDRRGDVAGAGDLRARHAELWRLSDAELRPLAESASRA